MPGAAGMSGLLKDHVWVHCLEGPLHLPRGWLNYCCPNPGDVWLWEYFIRELPLVDGGQVLAPK
eukprot:11707051-Prorocentrum_lima.AAC.1